MKRKNGRFLRMSALICTAILSFSALLPSAPGRRPAGARSPRARQRFVKPQEVPAPPVISAIQEQIKPAIEKELQEESKEPTMDAETAPEEEKEAPTQAALPAPTGFFGKAYTFATQLIIISLSSAVGLAIAAGTKSLIEGFVDRPELLEKKAIIEQNVMNLEAALSEKYQDKIKEGKFDLSKKDRKKLSEKYALLEQLDKNTSTSYIFKSAAYTAMIYAIINTISKLTGYGTEMAFRSLMPDQE